MKKKLLAIVLTGFMAVALMACGGKSSSAAVQTTKQEAVANKVSKKANDVVKKLETSNEPKYVNNNAVTSELDATKLTSWKMGTDIKNRLFNGVDMKFADSVLFLSPEYVSEASSGYLCAKGISIKDVSISVIPMGSIPKAVNYLANGSKGKVIGKGKYDNETTYEKVYYVQEAAGCYCLDVKAQAVAGSTEKDKAVFRSFVDIFAPAFEETLLANFE